MIITTGCVRFNHQGYTSGCRYNREEDSTDSVHHQSISPFAFQVLAQDAVQTKDEAKILTSATRRGRLPLHSRLPYVTLHIYARVFDFKDNATRNVSGSSTNSCKLTIPCINGSQLKLNSACSPFDAHSRRDLPLSSSGNRGIECAQ